MAEQRGNIQARLNAGIDAVRAGNLPEARRLLQQVITADPNNELAWMWMASAVTSAAERRACLERALKINPNNARAKEALRRLEAAPNTNPRDVVDMRETEIRRARRIQQEGGGGTNLLANPFFILAAIVLVLVVAGVVLLVNNATTPPPTPTATAIAQALATEESTAQLTEGALPPGITETALPTISAIIVPLDSNMMATLPPTFTPTFTNTPEATPTASATPLPLSTYGLIYSAGPADGAPQTVLRVQADGSRDLQFGADGDFYDVAVDPTGQRVAFVRYSTVGADEVTLPSTEEVGPEGLPQLFVAPIDDLGAAIQITRMGGTILADPTWSPDGSRLAFTSDAEGDENIYSISRDGGEPQRLTQNAGIDRDPAWSPDGRFIAYASDIPPVSAEYRGSPEIYIMNTDGSLPQKLTESDGDSYGPAWSPDSQNIVFVSTRSVDADLYIMDVNGLGENLLTVDDNGAVDSKPVFISNTWIAFISNRSGNRQVFLVDTTGTTVVPVTSTNLDVQSVAAAPAA